MILDARGSYANTKPEPNQNQTKPRRNQEEKIEISRRQAIKGNGMQLSLQIERRIFSFFHPNPLNSSPHKDLTSTVPQSLIG